MPLQYPTPRFVLLASAALVLAAPLASWAADAPTTASKPGAAAAKPAAKPAASGANKAAPKPAGKAASAPQAATAAAQALTDGQIEAAKRVLTGTADCEFKQRVSVHNHPDHAGHFHVEFKGVRYTMVPEETQTGAVRLFDSKAGVVWLQIPAKSMLMNAKIGQRMVDGCTQNEQRMALAAAPAASSSGGGMGIVPAPAAAPAAAAPAAVAPVAIAPAAIAPVAAAAPAPAASR